MRNLKKILALVLALVMSISVMTVASANFKDADKVNAKFETAVEVLNGLGVFRGYEDGTFNPTGAITRAEVAAIIYRIDTGDVKDEQVGIYADYNKFDDVKSTAWYAGYVNYCANATYIKGYDENTFGPNDKVTGYQALAMILRVVGYDKNGEFSGSAWQIETAKYANALGITKNVNVNTLGVAATRELVAELLFRTIYEVPTVTYTLLQGYNQYQDTFPDADSAKNPTIAAKMFGLSFHENQELDNWGRPGDFWYASKGVNKGYIVVKPYAPIIEKAEAVTECYIAATAGLYTTAQYGDVPAWVNGVETTLEVIATNDNTNNPAHLIGEQGTIIEVYEDRIILIDTYLAAVTATQKQVTDKAGHIKVPAKNTFTIFGVAGTHDVAGNEFATGDFMIVLYNEGINPYTGAAYGMELYAEPTMFQAKQTIIWWNAHKHTIDGATYPDNVNLVLNDAQYNNVDEFVWFLDTNNNVIGSLAIPEAEKAQNYAVVLGGQWINPVGNYGFAQLTVQYLDGTAAQSQQFYGIMPAGATEVVPFHYADAFAGTADFENGELSTVYQANKGTAAHLYEVIETKAGLVLVEVEDHYDDVVIAQMYSRVMYNTDPVTYTDVYGDNYTQYFMINAKTGTLDMVEGYENIVDYECEAIDVVFNKTTGFAQFVYIIGEPIEEEETSTTSDRYIYFTGKMLNLYEQKDVFAVYGVIDSNGSTEPLYFAKGATNAENEAIKTALLQMMTDYADKLVCITITDGIAAIDSIEKVTTLAVYNDKSAAKAQRYACHVAADAYDFYNTGVLKIGDEAYNVNHNTIYINENMVGVAIEDIAAIAGQNLYLVIGAGNIVTAIFITPTVTP